MQSPVTEYSLLQQLSNALTIFLKLGMYEYIMAFHKSPISTYVCVCLFMLLGNDSVKYIWINRGIGRYIVFYVIKGK
jgi:hypothetical protein